MIEFNELFELECGVQHYAWGARRSGEELPFIAELLGMDADPGEPFAELWIGAHPKCPSQVILSVHQKLPLPWLITQYPDEVLGEVLCDAGVTELPFLLKILDSAQALSVQAHPDLVRAKRLHETDPEHYPDANHKPEIAISVRGLDALCQFRSVAAIRDDVRRLEPLARFFAKFAAPTTADDSWLRACYAALFQATKSDVQAMIKELSAHPGVQRAETVQDAWFLRLNRLYPGDRGVISAYFLNIIHLEPGEAVFLKANEPHSYLQGTIVECMASSDNVVRAGLTPKFIDTDTLLGMLTYDAGEPNVLKGEREESSSVRVYRGNVPEFQVDVIELTGGESMTLNAANAVSLLLVLDGELEFKSSSFAKFAPRGTAWLWPAALPSVTVRAKSAIGVRLIRARPNLKR